MTIILAHKTEVFPTTEQEVYLLKATGVNRRAFNWGMTQYNAQLDYNRQVEAGEAYGPKSRINGRSLKKQFNAMRRQNSDKWNWTREVTAWAYQGAFEDLESAYTNLRDRRKKGLLKPPKGYKPRKDGKPFGWPRFRGRRWTPKFYVYGQIVKFNDKWITFDKRLGWLKMAECLRFEGKVLAARFSKRASRWWVSFQIETDKEPACLSDDIGKVVGIDLGVKYLATFSEPVIIDGQEMTVYPNPKPLRKALRKLKRLQRKLDRQRRANNPDNYDDKGRTKRGVTWVSSNRQAKTERQIAKVHFRVSSIREHSSHLMTLALARQFDTIVLEDLNVNGMLKNHRLSKSIADAGLYEKRRQIEYKSLWYGARVVTVDRWFPSSKTCNNCGWIYAELKLGESQWRCKNCKQVNERDENAAKNLAKEGVDILNNTGPKDLGTV